MKYLIQHTKMIFEGSCETEDWGNDCWKSSFASQEEITFSNIENIFFIK